MNVHIVSSGYCGLLDAVIAKAYPQAVRDKEITYEAGGMTNPAPQVLTVSREKTPPSLNDLIGFADMSLMNLFSWEITSRREDGTRVIPVGLSLVLELKNQEQELSCLITQAELSDVLRNNGWEKIRYSLSLVSQQQGFTGGLSPCRLLVNGYASLSSKARITQVGREDDVLSAFFRIMRESEWIGFHLRQYVRRLISLPEFN